MVLLWARDVKKMAKLHPDDIHPVMVSLGLETMCSGKGGSLAVQATDSVLVDSKLESLGGPCAPAKTGSGRGAVRQPKRKVAV